MRAAWSWGLVVAPIVVVGGLVAFATLRPLTVLPRQGLAPGFVLNGADGGPVSSEALRGSLVLYSFSDGVDTGDPALVLAGAVRRRLGEVGPAGLPVRLVTVAVDPAATSDPRSAAADVAAAPWLLVTGDAPTLKRVVGAGFGVPYGPMGGGGLSVEPALVLVDGWGVIRAEYRQPLPSADTMLRDLRLVADEARQSTGVARYAYEAAHLFACYPR